MPASASVFNKSSYTLRLGIFLSMSFMLTQILWSTFGPAEYLNVSGSNSKVYFFHLGFGQFISLGFCQLIFIVTLFLNSAKIQFIIKQVLLFLAAEIFALWMGAYNIIPTSGYIVHSMIPLTIIFIAIENIFVAKLKTPRLVTVFLFGLINGIGLAASLKDYGLNGISVFSSLTIFNLGAILAQFSIVLFSYFFLVKLTEDKISLRKVIYIFLNIIISMVSAYLAVQQMML